jgi:hypothetical protein
MGQRRSSAQKKSHQRNTTAIALTGCLLQGCRQYCLLRLRFLDSIRFELLAWPQLAQPGLLGQGMRAPLAILLPGTKATGHN